MSPNTRRAYHRNRYLPDNCEWCECIMDPKYQNGCNSYCDSHWWTCESRYAG
ncbi:MAG: hypothetical protein ACYDIA_05610 [Candidatus Humimicrobiaceae bacterium]